MSGVTVLLRTLVHLALMASIDEVPPVYVVPRRDVFVSLALGAPEQGGEHQCASSVVGRDSSGCGTQCPGGDTHWATSDDQGLFAGDENVRSDTLSSWAQ